MPENPHQNPDSGDANAVRRREEAEIATENKTENQLHTAETTPNFLNSIADNSQIAADLPKSKISSCLQS